MLGSQLQSQSQLMSSSTSHVQGQEEEIPRPQTAFQLRQLLVTCADLISQSDYSAAKRLLSILSSNSSPCGDSIERLVYQFVRALSIRLDSHGIPTSTAPAPHVFSINNIANTSPPCGTDNKMLNSYDWDQETLRSCYLSLNQITPFIRFSHLTANQAILEAVQGGQQAIHIIDFEIMHGVQWPPFMQALADRPNNTLYPPPRLRITGTGHDLNMLHRTGDRLLKFAQSLGLRFQFHPLLLLNNDPTSLALYLPSAITLLPDEALAVNCVSYLHRFLKDDSRELLLFLHKIKALNPKVVTVAEREANHNQPLFLQRFLEALDHYKALFDSLEATLPPKNRERLAVEQIWFGREIMDIVAAEGEGRRERHKKFETWEMMMKSVGFNKVPLSPFALSQAKLLLRLHYPSEGYQLQILKNAFFLGWRNHSLFSISSWQ
ncbi:PREDICTED: scarecrow-like protein 18 isoform X1 [Populus euphratica]|uniref:Scarecrow-like protein 18 isoform X1 n=1 Tax=Populus euphratica TaxID=75702 RepID=A0AAJ6VBA8_POPEU|nr:PREDICTED: scarecrow-like protein 18 isoform X1 [Populus euphratica]